MQHRNADRTALFPEGKYWISERRNEDVLRMCGLTTAEIEGLGERARGMDSLVLLCEERNLPTLASLLP